jgi:general secretion pathway protein F
LRDFGAKLDPIVSFFLSASSILRENGTLVLTSLLAVLIVLCLVLRRPTTRQSLTDAFAQLPGLRTVMSFHRTALFCRNLSVLTGSGMPISSALRILAEMMARTGHSGAWIHVLEQVRQGGKLSDALSASGALPEMAVRMLRLGEETGRLPTLANRVADFYQSKLQRSLDRVVAIAGPAAIITISIVVGGLIVSVMTSLLSVNQLVQ